MKRFLVTVLVLSAIGIVVGERPAAADYLRLEANKVWTVDVPRRLVHVDVDLRLANQRPNEGSTFYFFTTMNFSVQREAVNVSASRNGSALSIARSDRSEDYDLLEISLGSRLLYGQVASVRVSYDLPSGAPRSEGWTRVNDAYFTFFADASGDDGLGSLELRVPAAFDTFTRPLADLAIDERIEGDQRVFQVSAIPDPGDYGIRVTGSNEASLRVDRVRHRRHRIRIRSFPDDDGWAQLTAARTVQGLPVLERITGVPWPEDRAVTFTITESAEPERFGYGGFYRGGEAEIQIQDSADGHLILHELVHSWFNSSTAEARWITEGFAEELGARALAALGEPPVGPEPVRADDPGRLALSGWEDNEVRDDDTEATEDYGYNTSWFVVRQIANEIGPTRLRRLIVGIHEGMHPVIPDDVDGYRSSQLVTWQQFYDLLEYVAGSKRAPALFRRYVLTPAELRLVEARARSQNRFEAIVKASAPWKPPYAVRDAMRLWEFGSAERYIAASRNVLEGRARLRAAAKRVGVAIPKGRQRDYETAFPYEFDNVALTIKRSVALLNRIETVGAAVAADHGVYVRVGLMGKRPVQRWIATAKRAFERDDLSAARDALAAATSELADAETVGRRRLMMTAGGAGGVVTMIVLVGLGVRARRRRRTRRARRAELSGS